MSNCCPPAESGSGVGILLAIIGVAALVIIYIQVILTALLLLAVTAVALTVVVTSIAVFLHSIRTERMSEELHRTVHDRVARVVSQRQHTLQATAEVAEDGYPQEGSLQGVQGRTEAIHAAARAAAHTVIEGVPFEPEHFTIARPESGLVRYRIREPGDSRDQDRRE